MVSSIVTVFPKLPQCLGSSVSLKTRMLLAAGFFYCLYGCSSGLLRCKASKGSYYLREVLHNATLTHLYSYLRSHYWRYRKEYDQVGGEISEIKLAATDNYLVSISQEERLDRPSYRAKVEPCTITILKREISAHLPWQQR